MFRFVLPTEIVKDAIGSDEQMPAMFNYDQGVFLAVLTAGTGDPNAGPGCHVVMYPCRGGDMMNFGCLVPDPKLRKMLDERSYYSWNTQGTKEDMMEIFEGCPPWLMRIFGRAERVGLFQVRDQEPLNTYIKGRLVLIGDAAHPMLPSQAQGANQALEDAEGLNELFRNVSDHEKVDVLLGMFDKIRRPRVSKIQKTSRAALKGIQSRDASGKVTAVKPWVGMKEELRRLKDELQRSEEELQRSDEPRMLEERMLKELRRFEELWKGEELRRG